ncbi:MAG: phospholipase A, partial [Draconibacterium sp.]|nr:phospholipase A [Draconibacterium sp.]
MNYELKNRINWKFSRQVFAIAFLLLNFHLYSQSNLEKEYEFDLSLISEVHSGNSYITAGGGLGNIEPLIFEANLIPNFILRNNKTAKLMGVLTPQIILRMYNEESLPVQTPSYMPQITLYYSIGKELSINNFTMFGKIAHHSNGQQDDFYLENGKVNYKSGNFSTNYFEVGIVKTFFDKALNAAQFFSTSFEVHPEPLSIDELKAIYSFYRWHGQFAIFKLPHKT